MISRGRLFCPHCNMPLTVKAALRLRTADICARYEKGQAPKAIAHDLGLSDSTIYQALGRNNLSARTPPDVVAEGTRRALAGESPTALARELGVDRAQIYRWMRKAFPK